MKAVVCAVLLALACSCLAGPATSAMLENLPGRDEAGSIWALLVAGSNTWMNYRHQVGVWRHSAACPPH